MQESKYFSLPMEITELESYSFDDSLIPVDIKVMHSGLNANNSTFEDEAIELARDSLKNKPILGYIKKGDGEDSQDFAGHEVELAITDDGVKYTYLERPLGVVPEQNNYSILEEDGQKFVFCRGYLWKEYLNDGYSILKDNPNKSVSMEIAVDDYDYNEDGTIDINKYRYLGITILGDDVAPAMAGAELNVVGQFAEDSNVLYAKIEELNNQIASHFSANEEAIKIAKGGEKMSIDNKDAVDAAKGIDGVTPADVKKADNKGNTAEEDVPTTDPKVKDIPTEEVDVETTEPVIDKPKEVGLEPKEEVEKTLGKTEEEKEEINKKREEESDKVDEKEEEEEEKVEGEVSEEEDSERYEDDEEDENGDSDEQLTDLEKAKEAVSKAVETKEQSDIDTAQGLIDKLEGGEEKDELQSRLDGIEVDTEEDREEESADFEAKYKELSDKYAKLEEEVLGLRDFKDKADEKKLAAELDAARQEKIDYINDNYSNIDEDVKNQFIEKVDNYETVEAIDADICVYIVKNEVRFSQVKDTKATSNKLEVKKDKTSKKGSPYGNLFY